MAVIESYLAYLQTLIDSKSGFNQPLVLPHLAKYLSFLKVKIQHPDDYTGSLHVQKL